MNQKARFQMKKDLVRKRLLKYTRKAFRMLPQLDKPQILDVGCGSGVPTMELARLSNGGVMGIDVDEPALDEFNRKIKKAGLTDRIRAVNCSMFDMDFPDESFDIIWSEGSVYVIGFKRGLQEWKRFLKPNGFMVIHDEKGNVKQKLGQISSCGYYLLSYFILNEDTWWAEYFAPLEQLICKTRTRYTNDPKVLGELHNAQREVDMFKKNPELNSSAYFIMKRE
ncbi:class I SAM-dependent methyltransferase [Chloroflexota bacterium]